MSTLTRLSDLSGIIWRGFGLFRRCQFTSVLRRWLARLSMCVRWKWQIFKVTAVIPSPATWGDDPKAYLGEGFVLALEGCVDTRTNTGNALFLGLMRSELHAVRSVIEAYSRSAEIKGREDATTCGYPIPKGAVGITLRVPSVGKTAGYRIDRWD